MEMHCKDIAELHKVAITYVTIFGKKIRTEEGEIAITAPPINLIIPKVTNENMIAEWSSFSGKKLIEYTNHFLYGTKADFDYDYHNRLFHTPVNQVNYVVKKLNENRNTRRAVIHTWMGENDTKSKNVPCLQYIQFWSTDNKLNMYVSFRSNDVLSALGANAYALVNLQMLVACRTNLMIGEYTHSITIPHFYPKRDAEEYKRFIQSCNKKIEEFIEYEE